MEIAFKVTQTIMILVVMFLALAQDSPDRDKMDGNDILLKWLWNAIVAAVASMMLYMLWLNGNHG